MVASSCPYCGGTVFGIRMNSNRRVCINCYGESYDDDFDPSEDPIGRG